MNTSIILRQIRHSYLIFKHPLLNEIGIARCYCSSKDKPQISPRLQEFKKKLRETTPMNQLDEISGKHPYQEQEPLEAWPNNTNPHTGEVGGPRGPEPTRYGDWERKGRVSDF